MMTDSAAEFTALGLPTPAEVDGVHLMRASAIRPERVEWLWDKRLPTHALSLLVGMPGEGKSTVTVELASRISRGQLEGDHYGFPADVVLATAEDAIASVVVPRLRASGADLDRVHIVKVRRDGMEDGLRLPEDLAALKAKMLEVQAVLLVVDPVVSHLPVALDAHKDQHVRAALAPLSAVAEETGAAALGVVHLNKAAGTEALLRVSGSIGFVAAARSVLLAGTEPGEDVSRILAHAKSNQGEKAPSLRYRIEGRSIDLENWPPIKTSGVVWMGEADVPANSLLSLPRDDDQRRPKLAEARAFLEEVLACGPRLAVEVEAAAKKTGVSLPTLHRARKSVAISRKSGFGDGGRWVWSLKGDHDVSGLVDSPLDGRLGRDGGLSASPAQVQSAFDESPPEDDQGDHPNDARGGYAW